jgi:hypothetical protein
MEKDNITYFGIGVACFVATCFTTCGVTWRLKNIDRKVDQLLQEKSSQSKLENACGDVSKTGCVEIDGTPYLLKYDKNGMPVLSTYEVKRTEAVPEE